MCFFLYFVHQHSMYEGVSYKSCSEHKWQLCKWHRTPMDVNYALVPT